MIAFLKDIAKRVAIRYITDYEQELERENAMKRDASLNKEHLVDGYWQPRWRAEQRAAAAFAFYEGVREAESEILSERHRGLPPKV